MYFYTFSAKNVRHFGFGPLVACSTNYIVLDFWYVVEEVMSFHLVYNLLLLQFVLGYPPIWAQISRTTEFINERISFMLENCELSDVFEPPFGGFRGNV